MTKQTAEHARLATSFTHGEGWKKWGPYLSERQWGTVREDYSAHGTAWEYFPHDHARSRAYRWGEDGIGGMSDAEQRLCLGLALLNTRDPILKERLFGLTNGHGNHGRDAAGADVWAGQHRGPARCSRNVLPARGRRASGPAVLRQRIQSPAAVERLLAQRLLEGRLSRASRRGTRNRCQSGPRGHEGRG